MKTASAAPVEPVAAPSNAVAPEADDQNFRVAEQASLDDAAPVEPTEPEETPAAVRQPSRHDEQMAAIVARRREKLDAERAEAHAQGFPGQEPLEQAADAPAQPVDEHAAPAAPVQPQPASDAPQPAAEPAASIRTHKILVRGNEIVMSEDDMRRAAELGVESEARIRHANAVYEEARRLAAAYGQSIPGAGPASPPAAPPQPQTQAPSGLSRDALLEIARDIQYGDEEKVADALQRVAQIAQPQFPPQPAVDQEAMAREVYARIDARLGLQNALQTFGSEYPELVNDPDLATLTANYVQQLRAHYGHTQSPRAELDLYREAGNATRQAMQRWRGGAAAPQPIRDPDPATPQPQAAGQGRVAIKRNMPQAPSAAAAQSTPSAPREKTRSEIVNDMRRARGQPVYA